MALQKYQVAILMGSKSDEDQMRPCANVLKEFGVVYTAKALSAHRTPDEAVEFVQNAAANGIRVIIAAAGGAAHLAGLCATHTVLPVIGVPIESKNLKGLDSLLSTVQMPSGIPVGTVAIGTMGAENAAYYAIRIIGLTDAGIAKKIREHKETMRKAILATELDI